MIIHSIKLVNFGPFFGDHKIDLSVGAESPVILLHGENMRGKTSIVNAIKWCLYGAVTDRRGQTKGTDRLLSYDAIDAGEYHMSVELEFEHAGVRYQLERHVQSDVRPTRPGDMVMRTYLKRDGHIVPEETIVEEIGNILHPSISRFFLFDGEMLDEYEVLLGDPSRSTALVRESIEQILGLPALVLMVEDLGDLRREAEQRQLKAVEAVRSGEMTIARAQQVSNEVEALDDDLKELGEILLEVEGDVNRYRGNLDEYSEVQADIQEAGRLEGEISTSEESQKGLQEMVRHLLASSWWAPASRLASEYLEDASGKLLEQTDLVASIAATRAELAQFDAADETGQCPLCNQDIGSQHAHMEERRSGLARTLRDAADEGDLPRIAARVDGLRQFADGSVAAQIHEMEASIRRMGVEIRRKQRSVEGIRQRFRDHDVPSIREIEIRFEGALSQKGDIAEDIDEKMARRETLRGELSRLNSEIQRLPGADPRTAAEAALYGALEATFASGIDKYREQLRLDVEARASEIFRSITTEPGYAGLEINDQYGLSIVDEADRVIEERSAGAEQVVALSLIGALNASAVREGPVVMDTPFGRLDVGHRRNILEYIPTMSPQVVLLVQSGEFSSDRDRPLLEDQLAREYSLARDGGPTRSRIERYDHEGAGDQR